MATTLLVAKNRAFSKLAAAVNDSTTTFTVTAGEGANLPSTYPFHLTVEDEIVSVTNRSTDTLTVVRAQQSTSAAAHPNKAYIALNITAKSVTDLNTAVNTIEATVIGGEVLLADDKHVHLGTDSDITMLSRSTILNANTALTGVLVGTPVAQAIAADSLMIANVTASGDIAMYVNKGGHSQMVFWADGSSGDTAIMAASGQSVDIYIAGVKVLDISNDATKTTLLGVSGDYIRVGDAQTTQHSLNSEDDWMVTGDLEVTGTTFLDGILDITPSAASNYPLRISGTAILNSGEQAIYINTPSETVATNGIWITLGSTVTSGDLSGIRSRVTGNAASAGANVRGAYLEAKVGASKFAAMLEGALFHADYSAGSATISGDVRGFTAHISQGSGLNAANLYGGLINIQTRGDETITTDDVGLMIRNEAVGGNGRTMDAAIKIAELNMGGGTIPFAVDITFQNGATVYDDGTNLTFAGSTVKLTSPQINGTIATTGLAMPPFTLGGAISMGSQILTGGNGDAYAIQISGTTFYLLESGVDTRFIIDLTNGNITKVGTISAHTLAGTLTLNGQAFDAGSGNAEITTTGDLAVKLGGGLLVAEIAGAVADVAGYGQFWVKNQTPNEPWFTDDEGQDIFLGQGDSAAIAFDNNTDTTDFEQQHGWVKLTEFDTDCPENVSDSDAANSRIGVGASGVYNVRFDMSATGGGANKTYKVVAFEITSTSGPIASTTAASPVVVTDVGHPFITNDKVKITGVTTADELNDKIFLVTKLTADTYSLQEDNGGDINGAGYGIGSGGLAELVNELNYTHAHRKFAASDVGAVSGGSITTLTKDRKLELYLKNITDTTSITVEVCSFTMQRAG